MSRAATARDELRRQLTRAIVIETGTRESIAQAYTDAVLRCLDDMRAENGTVYVGAPERRYDLLQIKEALERGVPADAVMREHGLSRSKLHALFPGGLPKPVRTA